MTGAAPTPTAPVAPARPSTALRRALGLEWHRRRDLLALYGALALGLVLLAVLLDIRLGVVLILLAARLPADLADPVLEDGRQLRSALGISRADAVRARTVLVAAGQLALAVCAACIILVSDVPAGAVHWSSSEIGTAAGRWAPPPRWAHLVDIGLWSGALAWSHALVGGDAFRLGAGLTGRRAIGRFLGVCVLSALMLVAGTLLISALLSAAGYEGTDGSRFMLASMAGQALTVGLTLGGGVAALLLRHRVWARRA